MVVGTTTSNDFDVSGLHGGGPFGGNEDLWVVKTDNFGNIIWQRCFGGTYIDNGLFGEQTSDSGFVVIGSAESIDGDIVGSHGLDEIFVLRLDKNGDVIWKKIYGGTEYDDGIICKQLSDGNFILGANTTSNNGDISGNHSSSSDVWLAKLDTIGSLVWSRCYGGSDLDGINKLLIKNDGGFYFLGSTTSNDGDVTGQNGLEDIWLVELSNMGFIEWQACFGGSGYDRCNDAIITNDGGLVLVGNTTSSDGDFLNHRPSISGYNDLFVLKTDSLGNLLWSSCFGGTGNDFASSIVSGSGNNYLVCGLTTSIDYDITSSHGSGDAWIVKIEESPNGVDALDMSGRTFDCSIRNNNLMLNLSNLTNGKLTVFVFNISSQIQHSFQLTHTSGNDNLELPINLAQGIYFVQIQAQNSLISKKVINVY